MTGRGPVLDSVAAGPDLGGRHVAEPGGVAAFIAGEIPRSGTVLIFWRGDSRSYVDSVTSPAGTDHGQRCVARGGGPLWCADGVFIHGICRS